MMAMMTDVICHAVFLWRAAIAAQTSLAKVGAV